MVARYWRVIIKQPPDVFRKNKCSLKFRKIHRKTLVLESPFNKVAGLKAHNFIKKEAPTQVFSSEYSEIVKNNTYFEEHLWKTTSKLNIHCDRWRWDWSKRYWTKIDYSPIIEELHSHENRYNVCLNLTSRCNIRSLFSYLNKICLKHWKGYELYKTYSASIC